MTVLAAIGANALWLLYIWLLSCIVCAHLSSQKGYGEKPGLGTGLFLSALAVPIWLLAPAKPNSKWANRRARKAAAKGAEPPAISS